MSTLERPAHRAGSTQHHPRPLPSASFDEIPSGGMPIRCQFCSGQSFRRSRVRSEDFKQIILMRYPVRCLRCSTRQMVSFTVASISISSLIKHTRPIRSEETWKHWTGSVSDSSRHTTIQTAPKDE
jgi:hypothetical protein